jgi:hypothetical protein
LTVRAAQGVPAHIGRLDGVHRKSAVNGRPELDQLSVRGIAAGPRPPGFVGDPSALFEDLAGEQKHPLERHACFLSDVLRHFSGADPHLDLTRRDRELVGANLSSGRHVWPDRAPKVIVDRQAERLLAVGGLDDHGAAVFAWTDEAQLSHTATIRSRAWDTREHTPGPRVISL